MNIVREMKTVIKIRGTLDRRRILGVFLFRVPVGTKQVYYNEVGNHQLQIIFHK